MADSSHVAIVKNGTLAGWRSANPNTRLDLSGADFQGLDLSRIDLSGANLIGIQLQNCTAKKTNFTGADLTHADLSHAKMEEAILRNATLISAKLIETFLWYARLEKADLSKAVLTKANLTGAYLDGAILDEADISHADVRLASFAQNSSFRETKNADKALNLETITIPQGDVWFVDSLRYSRLNTLLSWERLRAVGKLPLFGASYAALIGIPIFFYGLDFYNQKIDVARAWAAQEVMQPGPHPFAELVLARLSIVPIPERSLWILLAAVSLGIASTIYSVFSPSRVREFSQDQRRDQLGRPAFHYLAHSWKTPILRIVSAFFYALGGGLAIWLIGEKVFEVFRFILRNM